MKEKRINTVLAVVFVAFWVFWVSLMAMSCFTLFKGEGKSEQSIDVIYPASAVVVSTDIMTDTVILDDGQNTWVLRGVEDWEVGDCVSMIMSTSGTTEIEDDVIVKARFSALTVKGE